MAPTYTVTASVGVGGMINPSGPVTVNSGTPRSFTVMPNSGYRILSISGTCGGSLNGSTYTTNPITADCSVQAAFTPITQTYTVTTSAGEGGAISPTSTKVNSGAIYTFTLVPNSGYSIWSAGGSCGGSLHGNTYTTNPITANCTVQAFFVKNYTITTNAGTGGTISPTSTQAFPNAVYAFTLAPNPGYKVASVSGCGGVWYTGNYYKTFPITADCTVTATFTQMAPTYTVTASVGVGGMINPSGPVTVNSGTPRSFTVTPNSGYRILSISGTCGGSLNGSTYTTNPIIANCSVQAAFTPITQ